MHAISWFLWLHLRFRFGVSVESSAARSEFLASRPHYSLKVNDLSSVKESRATPHCLFLNKESGSLTTLSENIVG